MNIYLLIGLPGSGKSYWLNQQIGNVFDDISQMDNGLEQLIHLLQEDKSENIYISDVNFAEKVILEKAIDKIKQEAKSPVKFHYILFINDESVSLNNVNYRNDGRNVTGTIKRFAKKIKEVQHFILKNVPSEQVTEIITPLMTNKKLKIN